MRSSSSDMRPPAASDGGTDEGQEPRRVLHESGGPGPGQHVERHEAPADRHEADPRRDRGGVVDHAVADQDGAEVAVIPPVSGGSGRFLVVDRPLDLAEVVEAVASPERGGLVTFRGDVRGESRGRRVVRLDYEAYVPMAERKLAEIGADLEAEHGARLAIVHRVWSSRWRP